MQEWGQHASADWAGVMFRFGTGAACFITESLGSSFRVRPVTPFSPRSRVFSPFARGRYDHLFMTQISIEAHKR